MVKTSWSYFKIVSLLWELFTSYVVSLYVQYLSSRVSECPHWHEVIPYLSTCVFSQGIYSFFIFVSPFLLSHFLGPLSRQRPAVTWTKRAMRRAKKFLVLWGGRCRCKKRILCRWVDSVQDLVLPLLCDTFQSWYGRKVYEWNQYQSMNIYLLDLEYI